jgi:hypothetical protein
LISNSKKVSLKINNKKSSNKILAGCLVSWCEVSSAKNAMIPSPYAPIK